MRSNKRVKRIITVLILFATLLLILMSPIFSVNEINISGNMRFAEQQIMDIASVSLGMNLFRFSGDKAEKRLTGENYIKSAAIEIVIPNIINIDIIERKTCGYVPYMGTYLYIDSDGIVLENSDVLEEPCPIVSGLNFSEFTVGEPLKVENTGSFDIVMTMSRILLNHNYIDEVKEMNISAPDDIHLYIANIDVSFGDINEADKKIRTIIEIMKTLSENDKGVLHIEDLRNTPYFTYTP